MSQKQHYLQSELYKLIKSDSSIFTFIQESSLDGMWYWDLESPENEWMSPRFWTVLGYDPSEMPHRPTAWQDIIFQEDFKMANDLVGRHLADSSIPYDQTVRYRHRDGSTVWIRCRGLAIRDEQGKPVRMLGAHSDITPLKQQEAELQQIIKKLAASQEEMQSFLDHANDLIQSVDDQGNFLYVNKLWCKVLEYTSQEAKSMTIFDVIDPEYTAHCQEQLELLHKTHRPALVNVVFRSKTGKAIRVEGHVSIQPQLERGSVTRGIFRDITDRYEAEEELRRTKEMLEQTNSVARVGGWEVDLIQNTVHWTHMTKEIHEVDSDFQPDLTTGINFFKEGYSRKLLQQAIDRAIRQGEPYDLALQIITAKGNELWVRAIGRAEHKDGQCVRLYGTLQDINEQKEKEFHRELLESVVTHANDGVMIFEVKPNDSSEPRIIYVNQAFCQITGYEEVELINSSPDKFYGPNSSQQELARIHKSIREGKSLETEIIQYNKQGMEYWANISVVPVVNASSVEKGGSVVRWVVIKRDISEQKYSEQALLQATSEARAASVAKSEFLANMSHEIRTPLNGVIGFSDLLVDTKLEENQHQYVQAIHYSANTLLGLINDILDFSKIEAGKLDLCEEKCSLRELLEQVSSIVKYKAEEKNLELLLNISSQLPQYAWTDPIRLRQILINLLSNAVKFTETGEIELLVELISEESTSESSCLLFSVRDTGIGIDPQRQKAVFAAFSQEDASTTRKYGGTGLGLTISNRLLNMMGSQMQLDSEPELGSNFYFKLQLKTEVSRKPWLPEFFPIRHALVVDDHPKHCQIIEEILATHNITSDTAYNGLEALEMIKANSYDALIIDDHIPYMDGFQVSESIRTNLNISKKKLPILLLHSSANDKKINKVRQSLGIQAVSKPITLNKLTNALIETNTPSQHAVKSSTVAVSLDPNISVLLVDDNPMNRTLAKTMLYKVLPNAKLQEAGGGREAIEKYKQHPFDFIFMDIQMPQLSGYEASKQIREVEGAKDTTIIALTARTVKGERERCLAAGMNDYITKPYVLDTLRNKLLQWIHPAPGRDEEIPSPNASANTTTQHFDLDKCKASMYIEENTTVKELARELFGQLDTEVLLLQQALQNEDLEKLRQFAHKHKSSTALMSMDRLSNLLATLEEQKTFDRTELEELIQNIESEIPIVKAMIERVPPDSRPAQPSS